MRGGGSEQHAVRDDAGASSADPQHLQEQGQEQQFCFLGLADLQQIGADDLRVQAALEGRLSLI